MNGIKITIRTYINNLAWILTSQVGRVALGARFDLQNPVAVMGSNPKPESKFLRKN